MGRLDVTVHQLRSKRQWCRKQRKICCTRIDVLGSQNDKKLRSLCRHIDDIERIKRTEGVLRGAMLSVRTCRQSLFLKPYDGRGVVALAVPLQLVDQRQGQHLGCLLGDVAVHRDNAVGAYHHPRQCCQCGAGTSTRRFTPKRSRKQVSNVEARCLAIEQLPATWMLST
jgi:hypothetical protein